ncbi:Zinc transporter 1 [Strongyloides ratti]|uniref:Zinc transporter 1 n=1 Tax=Strongyloides ratti TaxID=34506 RepID=A0A090KXR6_STRRB|nr:Zinc transporter 1 [Strongyloides ratti]CEF60657.1 Zinc transporter 1 [Strongyloides ratti]
MSSSLNNSLRQINKCEGVTVNLLNNSNNKSFRELQTMEERRSFIINQTNSESHKRKKIWVLGFIIGIHLLFFAVELTVGYLAHSIALMTDSFHMLADTAGFCVALVCVIKANKLSKTNTFGYARLETLGGFINSVGLLTLCLTIFFESIHHIVDPHLMENPLRVFVVGWIGLFINIIGMVVMSVAGIHSHGHSHGKDEHDDNHSHGGNVIKQPKKILKEMELNNICTSKIVGTEDIAQSYAENNVDLSLSDAISLQMEIAEAEQALEGTNLNMRGVFLHLTADALGSVAVIIVSGLIYWATLPDFLLYYLDPILGIFLASVIAYSTIPLFKDCATVLLQDIPKKFKIDVLKDDILKVESVVGLHHIHIWNLAGNRNIGSCHIALKSFDNWNEIHKKLKSIFHTHGVHSITIQPELWDKNDTKCVFECLNESCNLKKCCTKDAENGTN